jgi:serine/threonine-protein kinase
MSGGAIFLSYASQDAEAARRLCDALRAAGVEVWFDQSELRGGDAWDASIRKKIRECALFVPIISGNTDARTEGYFRLEWRLAVERSQLMADDATFLLPVVIGDAGEPTARVPDRFRERQWSRLSDEASASAFAERVKSLVGGGPVAMASTATVTPPVVSSTAAARKPRDDPSRIAVLPFANMSANAEDEFFADGMTEEIINTLAQVPGLRIAARTSCFAFKGRNEDLRVVGEKLGVGRVLEGSVRKAGARLRITAQLINVADGCHVWSERYDREMSDVFALQDEIAHAIAQRVPEAMAGEKVLRAGPANLAAYEMMLKGRVLLWRRGSSLVEARTCLEHAIEMDPTLAEAHALLGDAYRLQALYGLAPPTQVVPMARAAAQRALALDPNQVEALATLGNLAISYEADLETSFAIIDKMLARDPFHVRALCERGVWTLLFDGSPEQVRQAFADLQRAREIDPLNPWAAAMRSIALMVAGRLDEALAAARHGIALDDDNFTAHWTELLVLSAMHRHDEALVAGERALAMSGRALLALMAVAAVHADRGDAEAAEAIHREISDRAQRSYVPFGEQAAIAASAGHRDEAIALAKKAIAAHEVTLRFWKFQSWASFRSYPEGLALLEAYNRKSAGSSGQT